MDKGKEVEIMSDKKADTKKAPKKPATAARPKASGTTYNVTCDAKGNITKIVPKKK